MNFYKLLINFTEKKLSIIKSAIKLHTYRIHLLIYYDMIKKIQKLSLFKITAIKQTKMYSISKN